MVGERTDRIRTGRTRKQIVKLAGKTIVIFHKVVFHVFHGYFCMLSSSTLKIDSK